MNAKLIFLIHISLIAIFPIVSVCGASETERELSTGSILETVINDSQLQSMDELASYLHTFPHSTPYLDKIELRTETEDFDMDKQKYALRFYPKGWGETTGTRTLRKTRDQSQELAFEERFHKVLKDRYDLIIDYLETRTLMDIEKELLVNLEDQIRVLQALGPGDMDFDVGRLINTQDDRTDHQLNQVKFEDQLTGLVILIRQLTGCDDAFRVQSSKLITVADIRLWVTDLSEPANASSKLPPLLADRQMRVRLAEAEYNLEVAKNRDFISFFDVRYDMDEREETDKAVSLEVAFRLPFIHPDRDDILNRRVRWMEAKNDLAEVEKKWSQKRESTHRRILRYLDQHDVLNARKKTGEAATSYSLYRQMDGVNPLDLLKIRESILKNDMLIQKTWFAALRCFVDLMDLDGKLSTRPLVNYLSAEKERIL